MATPLFGCVSEFDPQLEDWTQYVKRLDHFFAANAVDDPTRKRDIFLSMLGPTTFKLLSSLVAPADPGDKTYKELVDLLKAHHNPEPSEVVQRLQFFAGSSARRICVDVRS